MLHYKNMKPNSVKPFDNSFVGKILLQDLNSPVVFCKISLVYVICASSFALQILLDLWFAPHGFHRGIHTSVSRLQPIPHTLEEARFAGPLVRLATGRRHDVDPGYLKHISAYTLIRCY